MRMTDAIKELRRIVDLHDLAQRLGLERPGGTGNYRSPHHKDRNPSLEIAPARSPDRWIDHSTDDAHGDALDLVQFVMTIDRDDALEWLCDQYGVTWSRHGAQDPARPRTFEEHLAERCVAAADQARAYLIDERKLPEPIVNQAIRVGAVGYNDWTNPEKTAGAIGYGGPAVAFIVKSLNPGRPVAVDLRYLDPELNGGLKTKSLGTKEGAPFCLSWRALQAAERVFVVESAINALSIEACGLKKTAALAVRGNARVVPQIDWSVLYGKQVYLPYDDDEPNDKGYCPGLGVAWAIHEELLRRDIAAQCIDPSGWRDFGYNDINDILQAEGVDNLRHHLARVEHWAIPGMASGNDPQGRPLNRGRSRVYLPPHDYAAYWRYRAHADFMTVISKVERDNEGEEKLQFKDLAGFRLAGLSRVTVSSFKSVMSGEVDTNPETYFAVAIQTPRHGPKLQRKVLEDERLHNLDQWRKLGPIFDPPAFLRLVNLFERASDIGSRDAINLVGLGWKGRRLAVNEGPDCYFLDARKQCTYRSLRFPRGSRQDARRVVQAYGATFKHGAALLCLLWGLGGHLKPVLGFWPHYILQADKAAGKSTLIKRLERTLAFKMLSGQSMRTAFRLVTSVSCTTHPVGWEELSAQPQPVIDEAVDLLQETYQHTVTTRGADVLEYLLCAPVLLAGEDVPVKSLLSKVVRSDLTDRQGPLVPDDVPPFPVYDWLQHLATIGADPIRVAFNQAVDWCQGLAMSAGDKGAMRLVDNYAALLACWYLLADWLGLDRTLRVSVTSDGQPHSVPDTVREEMNRHIGETGSERQPWVWILETALHEISSGEYRHPYKLIERYVEGIETWCLAIRPSQIMAHISSKPGLRDKWNSFPIKTDRILRRQMAAAGVIAEDRVDLTINKQRHTHLLALSVPELERWGLSVALPASMDDMDD